jgi:hypothetical protein
MGVTCSPGCVDAVANEPRRSDLPHLDPDTVHYVQHFGTSHQHHQTGHALHGGMACVRACLDFPCSVRDANHVMKPYAPFLFVETGVADLRPLRERQDGGC